MTDFIFDHIIKIIFAGVFLALLVSAIVAPGYYEETTETCTIISTDRTTNAEGSSDMRVYTEDCGTLAVGDSMFKGKFNSSELFGSLESGETYDLTHYGWRNGFFSMFPTVINADVVSE